MRPAFMKAGIGIVVVFGLLAAYLGVNTYLNRADTVSMTQSGNTAANSGNSTVACTIEDNARQKLTAASTGEVAAFVPMDRPYSLKHFAFKDADGKAKTIADWQGRVALVNLWATWCVPCRAEMPHLDALQRDRGDASFEVVAISVDKSEPSKPKAFYEEIAIQSLRFFHDDTASTLNALKREGLAIGLPSTLLVDGNGCVLGRMNGPAEWHSKDAINLINAAM